MSPSLMLKFCVTSHNPSYLTVKCLYKVNELVVEAPLMLKICTAVLLHGLKLAAPLLWCWWGFVWPLAWLCFGGWDKGYGSVVPALFAVPFVMGGVWLVTASFLWAIPCIPRLFWHRTVQTFVVSPPPTPTWAAQRAHYQRLMNFLPSDCVQLFQPFLVGLVGLQIQCF